MAVNKGHNIEILGVNELKKVLKELPNELGVKILQDINRSGAVEFKKSMQQKAPVGSDGIYGSIKIQKDKEDKTALLIGPSRKAYWARFIEFGTKVRKGRGRISPQAFIRPAIYSANSKATKSIFENMAKRVLGFLKRETKKTRKK